MGLFGNLFHSPKSRSVALIDVGADSIGVGYVHIKESAPPVLAYAKRVQLELREKEDVLQSVSRTLLALGEMLVKEGAPALLRESGSGHADSIIVAIDAPWEEAVVRSEKIERTKPFTFTRSILDSALSKSTEILSGRVLADQAVVGTLLDGYDTKKPIGKYASRVSVIVLSSSIEERAAGVVSETLKKIFHSSKIHFASAAAVRYHAFRTLFPHEGDYLILDSGGMTLTTSVVRRGLLVALEQSIVPETGEGDPWITTLQKQLQTITQRYPLPRTIFLVAPEGRREELKTKLESTPFQSLRLSNESAVVIPLTPAHVDDHVKLGPAAEGELELECLAIFASMPKP